MEGKAVANLERKRAIKTLPHGWEARLGLNGRVYYFSRHSQTVQILPPPESWSCAFNLPYGWEGATDCADKPYFINHILQQVTYEDPRLDDQKTNGNFVFSNDQEPPVPREYEIVRQDKLGFGFIAGSEKPVIIRTVSPGGPAENRLLPGDQIIRIGDENVKNAPRERVISLIRGSTESVTMTVIQPYRIANSSFLKPGKKMMRGMSRPRVRFSDENTINGEGKSLGSTPLLVVPGVLRVILEEGQSRSFQFNPGTTAGDIVSILCEKLELKCLKLYSLVLIPPKSTVLTDRTVEDCQSSDEILIAPWDHIAKILSNPAVKHHECHFRLTFVAKDIHKLSREDPNSFKYHYEQCVNDVVKGNLYANALSNDDVLRLASLQMLEMSLARSAVVRSGDDDEISRSNSKKGSFHAPSKVTLKQIEKDYGLERFLPPSICKSVADNHSKENRKTLQQYLKNNFTNFVMNGNGASPSASSNYTGNVGGLQSLLLGLRMQYVKLLSPHHLYGGRYFEATILAVIESDITLIVGYHYGVSQMINSKTKMASIFGDFSLVRAVEVAPCAPEASKTNVRVDFNDMAPLILAMHPLLAQNFAIMVAGYCRVHDNDDMMLTLPLSDITSVPDYFGPHKVMASHWNFPPNDNEDFSISPTFFYCDFSEPVSSSLLSGQIPESVRAMFQQSKITDEESSPVSSKSEQPELSSPDPDFAQAGDGVALDSAEKVSPSSSASSMMSITTSNDSTLRDNDPASVVCATEVSTSPNLSQEGTEDDKTVVSEISNDVSCPGDKAVHSEEDSDQKSITLSLETQKSDSSDDKSEAGEVPILNDTVVDGTADISTEDQETQSISSDIVSEEFGEDSDLKFEASSEQTVEVENVPSNHPAVEKRESQETAETKLENTTDLPTAAPRSRVSSFKPSEISSDGDDNLHKSSYDEPPPDSGNAITSEELSAHLKQRASSIDAPVQLDGEQEVIVSSPLPVNDLASQKSLREKKRSNRMSWFGGRTLPRTVSLDKGLSKSERSPKSRSFFRFFSSTRSYSVDKEKENSLFSHNGSDHIPGSGSSSKWRFGRLLSSPPTQSPKRSRFSFFRLFSRRSRSADISSPENTSPPIVNDSLPGGIYATLGTDTVNKDEEFGLKNSSESVVPRGVHLRSREKASANARPLSFMTFQQLPTDFKVQRFSSKRSRTDDISLISQTSPSRTGKPKLPIDAGANSPLVRKISNVNEEEREEVTPPPSAKSGSVRSTRQYKLSTSLNTEVIPPPKPARQYLKSTSSQSLPEEDSNYDEVCEDSRNNDYSAVAVDEPEVHDKLQPDSELKNEIEKSSSDEDENEMEKVEGSITKTDSELVKGKDRSCDDDENYVEKAIGSVSKMEDELIDKEENSPDDEEGTVKGGDGSEVFIKEVGNKQDDLEEIEKPCDENFEEEREAYEDQLNSDNDLPNHSKGQVLSATDVHEGNGDVVEDVQVNDVQLEVKDASRCKEDPEEEENLLITRVLSSNIDLAEVNNDPDISPKNDDNRVNDLQQEVFSESVCEVMAEDIKDLKLDQKALAENETTSTADDNFTSTTSEPDRDFIDNEEKAVVDSEPSSPTPSLEKFPVLLSSASKDNDADAETDGNRLISDIALKHADDEDISQTMDHYEDKHDDLKKEDVQDLFDLVEDPVDNVSTAVVGSDVNKDELEDPDDVHGGVVDVDGLHLNELAPANASKLTENTHQTLTTEESINKALEGGFAKLTSDNQTYAKSLNDVITDSTKLPTEKERYVTDVSQVEPEISHDDDIASFEFPPPPDEYKIQNDDDTKANIELPRSTSYAHQSFSSLEKLKDSQKITSDQGDVTSTEQVTATSADRNNVSILTSPRKASYHSLITPLRFGQQNQAKTFSKIKPPSVGSGSPDRRNSNSANVSDSTADDVSKFEVSKTKYRSVRPPLLPKPVLS